MIATRQKTYTFTEYLNYQLRWEFAPIKLNREFQI